MSWWSRPRPVQTDEEKQAQWSNWSRAVGEGQFGSQPMRSSFFQRFTNLFRPEEQRAITALPWNTGGSLQGPSTTPSVDGSLALGAVYAATSLIARTIAGLPLHAYRDVNSKKTELNQLPSLFDEPSVQGDLFDWLHRCVSSMLMWGNAYGLVTNRDGFGYPTGVEWLSPEHMTVVDFAFTGPGSFLDPVWRWRGRVIPKENLVHIPWYTLPWRVRGLSPLGAYAASVNTGLGAQRFSSDWYDSGGVPPGTFKNSAKTVAREEAQEVKNRLTDSIRTHQPIVYGADWDYNPIAINPAEARFIETMKLTATQVAVIYGVPPDRIGGEKSSSLTYSTVEQDSIDFVQFTILNYARKLESAFFKILPLKQYVRFDLDALIRPDIKTRYQVYMLSRQMGLRNIDEIRDLENLPPLPNGDGQDYAPLLATGLAVDPEDQPPGMTSGDPAASPVAALTQVLKAKPRQPYKDTAGNGRSFMDMPLVDEQKPLQLNLTINNITPERQMVIEHRDGDITVQPSPPADVRVELPVTFHPPDVQVPVTVNTPEVRVNSPVTVNTPEVRIPVNVQAARAPDVKIDSPVTVNTPEVRIPVTVQPAAVTVDAPVTVNTPEVQVRSPDVNVQPAVINVMMPDPKPRSKQITTKRNADGSTSATIREKED